MTDYLKLLLERLEEEEEDREAMELDEAGEPVRARPDGTDRPGEPAPTAPSRRRQDQSDAPRGRAGDVPRSRAPGGRPAAESTPDAALRSPAPDAADRTAAMAAPPDDSGGGAGQARRAGAEPIPLPARRRTGDGGDGAAQLAQRLTQLTFAQAAAPAQGAYAAQTVGTPAAADWDAFDRRLERDARRYDGGLGMY